jgi:cyclase
MIKRGVIVAKIKPGSEQKVAEIFAESDKSDLPKLVGCRHRSLYILGDLYVHYVETDSDFTGAVSNVRDHPLFKEISKKLEPYISPYKADWKDHRDATAVEFYSWDAPQ